MAFIKNTKWKRGMALFLLLSVLFATACRPVGLQTDPEDSGEETGSSEETTLSDLDSLSEQYLVTDDETAETTTESEEPTTETTEAPTTVAQTPASTQAPKPVQTPKPTNPPAPTQPPVVWTAVVNKSLNYVLISRNGEPVRAFICSVGATTPTGVFRTTDKYTWRALFGNVWGQYATRITGSILFHSVPYYQADPATLETEEYNKLGTTASAGCVRMTVAGCKWIFDNCPRGMQVTITTDATPCPIGIEGAQKIPSEAPYCNWDPTDPNPRNPWRNYVPPTEATTEPESSSEQSSEESSSESVNPPETTAETTETSTPAPETTAPENN